MFRIFQAPKFQKKIDKLLTKNEHIELNNFIVHLKNWQRYGKPLSYDFLREKKIGS
jgi:hypothetical protein